MQPASCIFSAALALALVGPAPAGAACRGRARCYARYAYDPRADRWTTLPDLPIGVHGLKGSAVIGGRIFLPEGGITLGGNSGTNAMQVYRPTMRCE